MKSQDARNKSLGLKIICLLMAIMLWFYVVNQGGLATGKNMVQADLNYYNVPTGLTVVGPQTVSVKLWGALGDAGNIVAYADLAGMSKGLHNVEVKVKPLKGAMFATVQPDKVKIELKEMGERILPVKYEVKQKPVTGFELREIMISPEKCMVRGEQAEVNRVATLLVPLNLTDSKGIETFQATIQAKDSQGNLITDGINLIPKTVKVYVVVEKPKELKTVAVKSQLKGKVAEGFKLGEISIDPAEVSVLGDKMKMTSMVEILSKEIDITDKQESFTQTVDLQVPEGVTVSPVQVNIKVEIDVISDKEVQP